MSLSYCCNPIHLYNLYKLIENIFEYSLICSIKDYLCSPKIDSYFRLQWPVRLGVRTLDFHSRNRGSIPLRATEIVWYYRSLAKKSLP